MGQNTKRTHHREWLTEQHSQHIVTWTPELFLLLMLVGNVVSVCNAVLGGSIRIACAGLLTVLWAGTQGVIFSVTLKRLRKKEPHLLRWVSGVQCGVSAVLLLLALFCVLNTANQSTLVSAGGAVVCAIVCLVDCWSKYGN